MPNQTHLSLDDRIRIQERLTQRESFRSIALELDKDPTTISKEIKSRLQYRKISCYGKPFNDCRLRMGCPAQQLCGNKGCRRSCKFCKSHSCRTLCSAYVLQQCDRLSKPPYVCNGCEARNACTLEKRFYDAKAAQAEYEEILTSARQGIQLTEEEALRIDAIISPLLLKGQSLHHILINHADEIMQDERTIYRYVDQGVFDARNIDMPRVMRMGKRRKKKGGIKVDRKCRENRTYDDFCKFMIDHPDLAVVEIDSVEGRKGGKVLLTVHFVIPQFMLIFLRDANTSQSVIDVFDDLYEVLGKETFERIFNLLLGDNGSEFSNPHAIETAPDGGKRTRVFYCNPSAPYQKGAAENNHTMLRRVIPKGTSLDDLTEEHIRRLMNHVNSYARNNLGDQTPYAVFQSFYGEDTLKKLGAELIPPDEIILRPTLLK